MWRVKTDDEKFNVNSSSHNLKILWPRREEYGADKLAISQNKAMMCEEISPMNNKLKLHFRHQTEQSKAEGK